MAGIDYASFFSISRGKCFYFFRFVSAVVLYRLVTYEMSRIDGLQSAKIISLSKNAPTITWCSVDSQMPYRGKLRVEGHLRMSRR